MQNFQNPLIFVVEDNPVYNDLITGVLRAKQFKNLRSFKNTEECMKNIHLNPDIVVLNYAYTGITGLDLMKKVHETKPGVTFIFLSGQNSVEVAVKIMRHGAFDYIVKDETAPERLVSTIHMALTTEKRMSVKKGLRNGAILFFIIVIIMILLIFSLSFFSEDFKIF